MKTVQDWGFIGKDQGLVKPKLQDNKIFHALTSAYESNQQQEIYGATENIVRREKELCEYALADLKKLSNGKGDGDGTLKLIMEHYQTRLRLAKEKEEKINELSEDSRKMTEEYKKKTQELADVKRSLMDSQTKLRELAKTTEKLLKREEELRFIESNLRTELDKNKRNIINGLYEIVADLPETGNGPELSTAAAAPAPATPAPGPIASPASPATAEAARPFQPGGLFRTVGETPAPESVKVETLAPRETAWTRDEPPAAKSPLFASLESPQPPAPQHPVILKPGDLLEKAVRLKMFEPGKTLCSKSLVKTAEGEVISEYFYSPLHAKESRNYIFNTLHALSSLLNLKSKDEEAFQERLETLFSDLLSRLEHSKNIHLESFLSEEINRDSLERLMAMPRKERPAHFEQMASRILARIESVGQARAGLIEHQFRIMPKSKFPPGDKGIAA